MKSIRKQFFLVQYLFIAIILGIPTIILLFCGKPYCISRARDNVDAVYDKILKIDFKNITEDDYIYLKECEKAGMSIAIGYKKDGKMEMLYGTSLGNRRRFPIVYYRKNIEKNIHKYEYNPKARSGNNGNVKIYGLVDYEDTTYYIRIRQSLRMLLNTIESITVFVIILLVAAFAISSILIAMFTNKLSKPIKNMERVANKMSNLDFSEKVVANSKLIEIESLTDSINKMAIRIKKYLSDLENYNYCLKEENYSMTKLESQRSSCVNSISHELKTPLAIVSSQLALIEDMPDQIDKGKYFDSINEEISKMSSLISKLLNNSFELSSSNSKFENIDLSSLIKAILQKYRYIFEDNGIFFDSEISPDCNIYGDVEYLEMAIRNYLTNAVEHTHENGSVHITLNKDGEDVVFAVYNQGEHIPEDILPSIWDRYFSHSKQDNIKNGNIGMGLSIVKSVVNIHSGECYVKNTPDGVTFYMKFQLIKE